ncbi:MAG: hypothetical protein LBB67_00150 [Oscillospiraceae bacterium]|jgi:hypothetical protein|nr:hypothetical protein [Oscillospiraceae bacterium]
MPHFGRKNPAARTIRSMRPLAIPLSIVLTVFMLFGGTMAWFISTDGAINRFVTSKRIFKVEVVDVFVTPSIPPKAGDIVNKRVGASNTGDVPAFVRIMVLPRVVADDGETTLPAGIGKEILLPDLNTTDWADGGDGYYYYLHKLNPGTSTTDAGQDLFTQVKLAASLPASYEDASLRIEVTVESVGTAKWNYRETFWDSPAAITGGALLPIDTIWASLATVT